MWFACVKLFSYALAWAAFPLTMIWVSRFLRLSAHYISYIIAWNWSQLLQVVVILATTLLDASGILPIALSSALIMFSYIIVLVYACLVAKAGLYCNTFTAIGVVAFNVVLELFIDLSTNTLL